MAELKDMTKVGTVGGYRVVRRAVGNTPNNGARYDVECIHCGAAAVLSGVALRRNVGGCAPCSSSRRARRELTGCAAARVELAARRSELFRGLVEVGFSPQLVARWAGVRTSRVRAACAAVACCAEERAA